ncbi:hypothetical protein L596_008926 [Steinernema carpocapsae]|uniref:Uncharacterized protein n=1 Tax=Steinernema carpocapsae TaxID=34508 RepID=A0A4U5PE77_STECR|nr:hypothetical protein L596_008926 [Steinernema carpocapsae]
MSVSSRPPSGFPFTLILSRTPAMIGRISVSLFVLAVTVSTFAAADEVTNPLAINLTGFRDELLSEMKDDLTKLLKLMSAEAMQMKQKFVTDVDRELKKCVKINDTTTRIFCFKDIQEKAKITEAKKRESIENDIDELKIRVADEFQLKFEEGVRNRSEDLKKRLKGIFKDLQKIPRELQGKVKHAIDAGVEDAQRRQENITAQFGKPLAIGMCELTEFIIQMRLFSFDCDLSELPLRSSPILDDTAEVREAAATRHETLEEIAREQVGSPSQPREENVEEVEEAEEEVDT